MSAEQQSKKQFLISLFGQRWFNALGPTLLSNGFNQLMMWVGKLRELKYIYPAKENVFKAFQLTPYDKVKVVFLGLDPYASEGQALGVSFGIDSGEHTVPRSLRILHEELESDLGCLAINFDFTLKGWA